MPAGKKTGPTPKAPQNAKPPRIPGQLTTAFAIGLEVSSGVHKELGAVQVADYDTPGGGRVRLIYPLDLAGTLVGALAEGAKIAAEQAAAGNLEVVESKLWTPSTADPNTAT